MGQMKCSKECEFLNSKNKKNKGLSFRKMTQIKMKGDTVIISRSSESIHSLEFLQRYEDARDGTQK